MPYLRFFAVISFSDYPKNFTFKEIEMLIYKELPRDGHMLIHHPISLVQREIRKTEPLIRRFHDGHIFIM